MHISFDKEVGTLFSGKKHGVAAIKKYLKNNSCEFVDGSIVVSDREGQLITSSFVFGLLRGVVFEWASAGIIKCERDILRRFDISGMQEINKSEFCRAVKRISYEIMESDRYF